MIVPNNVRGLDWTGGGRRCKQEEERIKVRAFVDRDGVDGGARVGGDDYWNGDDWREAVDFDGDVDGGRHPNYRQPR